MTLPPNDLPSGLLESLCQELDCTIVHLERHVARREAWIIDLERSNGEIIEGFLRIQRETAGDPRRLEREVRIIQSIRARGIPAPDTYAWLPEFRAALFERDAGRSDIDKVDNATQQRAVMEDFIAVVARFHNLDCDELGLDDIMLYQPQSPRECALREVDELVAQWQFFLQDYKDPLLHYALHWLERFAPTEVARVSLLQGDTGPVNFMFQGNAVSAVIDWETGHFGDPLEDLGNIAVREFWNPSGGLSGLFTLYEELSGIPYDQFRTRYYAVQQQVRGMIPIHYVAMNGNAQESLAWYLCYRYLGDRATIEMLAKAMNVSIQAPTLPNDEQNNDVLLRSVKQLQTKNVLPNLHDKFAASRANDLLALVDCIDRKNRFAEELAAAELADFNELLGAQSATLAEAHARFAELIAGGQFKDEDVLVVLARKAYRDEFLYQPAVSLYPSRQWSDLD